MSTNQYADAIQRLKDRHGDKFVEPKTTAEQRRFFGGTRVEVVSPTGFARRGHISITTGFARRGHISITTGWQPSLMLMHRKGNSGSWDLLNDSDVIAAYIDSKHVRYPLEENALQCAVYMGDAEWWMPARLRMSRLVKEVA